jgi:4-hydroxy-tetrahydrodipicolinate synthase
MFQGVFTALITPFKYGEVDLPSFQRMIEWQIESGIAGLLIGGSTGEGQSLTQEELLKTIEVAVQVANKKVKIFANTGLNSTANTIKLTQEAEKLDVDGVMLVAPYYIKPTQEGMYQHFKSIHDLSNLPIIIYNNPGRTAVDISNDTLIKLAELDRVMAVKDSTGNVVRAIQLRQKSKLQVICGDDPLMLPFYSQGAVGLISVAANIVPSLMVRMHELWHKGEVKEAMELQDILHPLNEVLYCETNPVPLKYAASQFELCAADVRLPLAPLAERNKKLIRETLQTLRVKLYEGV